MIDRPTLPPLDYLLWLPKIGAYVQDAQQFNRRIIHTGNPAAALELPEPRALRLARQLLRRTGQVIELRPVHRAVLAQPGAAS